MTQISRGDLLLQDELGNLVDSYPVSIRRVIELIYDNLSQAELEKTICLQFIDEYGDTTFNELQTKILLKEFESLLVNAREVEQEDIKSIMNFISKIDLHLYIKFIGN